MLGSLETTARASRPVRSQCGFAAFVGFLAILAVPAGAQVTAPSAPAPSAPATVVVVPGQRTAAQNSAAAMGKQVSNQDIARAIKNSGLSAAEVRTRLQQAGFDPKLADPFFATGAPVATVSDPSTLAAINSLGLGFDLSDETQGEGVAASQVAPEGDVPSGKPLPLTQRRFGRDVFTSRSTSFEPETNGPVDPSYRLGVGDAVQIVMTGQVEAAYEVPVRRDGTILLQNLGSVPIAGLMLESARAIVRDRAARSYSGIGEGKTSIDLTVTKLRANQVRIIGEVERPGAYQVNGLATVFHALARAGGPSEHGSFRNIELRRGGTTVKHVDLYDYLIKGDATSDVRTEQGDMIFVPPAMRSVTVIGAMRRQGIFELKDGEGFRDLMFFAGGLLPSAAMNRVHIDRTLPPAQRKPGVYRVVLDIPLDERQSALDTLKLWDDDVITVYEIGDLRRNSVKLSGPVNQPGTYEWKPGETLGQLLAQAQSVLPWALTDRVKVKRQIPRSGQSQFFSLDLSDAVGAGFILEEFDEVSVLDAREASRTDRVSVRGAVKAPGDRPWSRDLRLQDLIDVANGFQPYGLVDRVLITRRDLTNGKLEVIRVDTRDSAMFAMRLLPMDEVEVPDARVANPEYSVNISGAVYKPGTRGFGAGMTLQDLIDLSGGFRPEAQYIELARVRRGDAYSDTTATVTRYDIESGSTSAAAWRRLPLIRDDRVVVRASPGTRNLGSVSLIGLFRYPGSYVIQRDDERLSDLIRRAGGILPSAYPKSLRVTRKGRPVPVSYEDIVRGGNEDDLAAEDGDQLQIEAETGIVTVAGAVQRQVSVPFRSGWSIRTYIDAAGGFSDSANTSNIIVTYASGAVKREKTRFHMVTDSPRVEAGSTITVGAVAADKGNGDYGKALTITAQAFFTLTSLLLSYLAIKK